MILGPSFCHKRTCLKIQRKTCIFPRFVSITCASYQSVVIGSLCYLRLLRLARSALEVNTLITLAFNCVWFSVDPTKGHVELSLKGTDVGGPDPAPKPKRLEEKEKRDKERKEQKRKRKKGKDSETKDESDDEAEEILKRLKTGRLRSVIIFLMIFR